MQLLAVKRFHRLYRTNNGVDVLITQAPGTATGSISLWLPCGSFDDGSIAAGATHVFEHTMCSGEVGGFGDPFEFAEGLGGEFEAATYYDYMRFQIRIGVEYLPNAIEVLMHLWLRGPNTDSLHSELAVVQGEWHEYADIPEIRVDSAWRYSLGIDAFYGGFREEWLKQMNEITARDLQSIKRLAEGRGILLQIVSPSQPESIRELLETGVLRHMPSSQIERCPKPSGLVPVSKYGIALEYVAAPRSYLAVGLARPQGNLTSHACGRVLLALLCEGAHSRLYKILRTKMGLIYDLATDFDLTRALNIFSFSTSFDNKNVQTVSNCVAEQLQSIANGLFSEQEFARAKTYLRGRNNLYCEAPYNHGKLMGRHYMATREFVDSEDFDSAVASVTPAEVTRMVRDVLTNGSWAVAVRGPLSESCRDTWLEFSQWAQ